jgi:hypothetical protein
MVEENFSSEESPKEKKRCGRSITVKMVYLTTLSVAQIFVCIKKIGSKH